MSLHEIHIQGFKSIQDQDLFLGPLNVFIGGNGSGKSNLIGVFHFLNKIVRRELQTYTGEAGGANALLHFGRKRTQKLGISVVFTTEGYGTQYLLSLKPTEEDRFIFDNETAFSWNEVHPFKAEDAIKAGWYGHAEARVAESGQYIGGNILQCLNSYRIYHFHDVSSSAKVKLTGDVSDNRFLRADAGNLAAFLYLLKQTAPDSFNNIQDTIQQVAPFFQRFMLEPDALNPEKIRLSWEEKGSDTYFGPSTLSDGTLRFICLATLLLQPSLPSLILIDEPELGLHPAAIVILAALLQSASTRTQLIVATQSVTLINQLLPEQVWVVDREEGASVFKHLKDSDMSSWLDEYGLGDLWEKNILGGRP